MTTPAFDDAVRFVLRWEGGFSDHPKDPGGRTMRGVTQAVYTAWRQAEGRPARDVREIDDDELHAIYRANYWQKARCQALRAALDLAQFDTAVNMGPNRAVKILQTAVGAAPDGAFGPRTQAACDACAMPDTVARYCDVREGVYRSLAQNPDRRVFLKGWLNRLDDLRVEAGIPGYSRPRSVNDEPMAHLPDLGPDESLEAWR